MSIREMALVGASSYFGVVKIGLMIIFVAVLFATIFATLKRFNIDIGAIAKKYIFGKKNLPDLRDAYRKAEKAGLDRYAARPPSQPCENEMCSRLVDAAEDGTLVRNGRRRIIVCAECAPAYVKTGWIPEITWGEDFKSAAIGLVFGAATRLNLGVPINVFQGIAPPPFLDPLFAVSVTMGSLLGIGYLWRKINDER